MIPTSDGAYSESAGAECALANPIPVFSDTFTFRGSAPSFRHALSRWPAVLALASMLAFAPAGLLAQQSVSSDAKPAETAPPSGLRAYLDPEAGRLVSKPPDVEEGGALSMPVDGLEQFSTSHQGLVSEMTPDGGIMVDLRGRFRQGTLATIDESGEVRVRRIGGEMFLSPEGESARRNMDLAADEPVGDRSGE